jgi:hypothetical protein
LGSNWYHYSPGHDEEYSYDVHMLDYVELSPDYKLEPGSTAVQFAQEYRDALGTIEPEDSGKPRTLSPFVIEQTIVPSNTNHLNPDLTLQWRISLQEMTKTWSTSAVRSKL